MVRLIGAAVNAPDRPQGHRPGETAILVKADAAEAERADPPARSTNPGMAARLPT
jgi:hypothetical protein